MSHLFTVWTRNRNQKIFVIITEGPNLLERLILKASEKLNIDGSRIVLESNGTPVDEDDILLVLKTEVLILLNRNEQWVSVEASNLSLATTVTLSPNNSICDNNLSKDTSEDTNNDYLVLTESQLCNVNTQVIIDSNLEYTWLHMDVPWNKIPSCHIELLESGKKWQECKSAITEICHIIVHEMRQVKPRIPVIAFKGMAQKIVSKYPKTFLDLDADGVPIGDGTYFLIRKLIDRNNYLNRPHKRGWESPPTPLKYRKKQLNMVAGCSNWEDIPHSTTKDNQLQVKLNKIDEKDSEFFDLLEKTFSEQRTFINNVESPPTVQSIKAHWPVLFKMSAIKWHFQKVTGTNLESLITSIEQKADKILEYGYKRKLCSNNHNPERKIEECLKMYAKYFKEDISKFILSQDVHKDSENFKELISINAPCIVECTKDVPYYKVFMEREEVYECPSFKDSLMVCFGLYFVMNLMYPKEMAITLEMIQRFHLKIHPDTGTKAKSSSKGKVLTLMKNLSCIFK